MKKNRTYVKNKPRGWVYGAKWGGVPCEARVCVVVVGVAPGNWWCANLIGQERPAIEIKLEGQTVYIDNDKDWALTTLLEGRAPLPKFRFMPAFQVKDEPNCELFYKAEAYQE